MNIKFSQLQTQPILQDSDLLPIVRSYTNYVVSGVSIYRYLSGDKFTDLYTNYNSNSGYFLNVSNQTREVYSQYSSLSSFYVLNNTNDVISGVKNFTSGLSANIINANTVITQNGTSDDWNSTYNDFYTYANDLSSTTNLVESTSAKWNSVYSSYNATSTYNVASNPTHIPGASAINNIVLITQLAYNNLQYIDPKTLYVIQ